jgi:broad specificity phosphatase PhoE
MKTLLLSIIFLLAFVSTALAQPTIYLARHAEKLDNWPADEALEAFQPLSAKGIARARKLAEHFKPGEIAAIFSSRTTRTLHTALPLAQKLGLSVEVADACMDTAAIAAFYKNLAQHFGPDKSVVLVTHSNIIPYLLIKAGLPRSCYQEIGIVTAAPNEWLLIEGYGYFWKVENPNFRPADCPSFVRIKY